MQDPDAVLRQYYADPVLASLEGHKLISDVLTSYFQSLICAAWSAATGTESEALPGPGMLMAKGGGDRSQPKDAKGLFGGVAQRIGAAGAHAFEPILKAGGDADGAAAPVAENANQNPNKQLDSPTPNSQLLYPALDRKSTRLNSSHSGESRMPSSA